MKPRLVETAGSDRSMNTKYFALLARSRRTQAEVYRIEAEAVAHDPYISEGSRSHERSRYLELAARYEQMAAQYTNLAQEGNRENPPR